MFLGVLGFFGAVILVSTVLAEVRGEPSLARALTLAVFVVLILLTLKVRRSLQRQPRASARRGPDGPQPSE